MNGQEWRIRTTIMGERSEKSKCTHVFISLVELSVGNKFNLFKCAASILGYVQYFKSESNEKRAYSFIKFVVELFKTSPSVGSK